MQNATDLFAKVTIRQGIFSCFNHRFAKLHRVPAATAILVQMVAALTVLMCVLSIYFFEPIKFSIFSLVLMQAIIASIYSNLVGMARWWNWIHFCFPLGLWVMSMWQVPNELYLAGFLITLSLYWTTFRTQVPFYPSRPIVWQKVAELLPTDKAIRLIDIGSGLGDLSMHISRARPLSQIEGIEIAPLPWLVSMLRANLSRSKAIFKLGDYNQLDFSQYDIVFAYLSPAAMPALWQKAQQEMRTGCLLLSYEFLIPNIVPSFCIAGKAGAPEIYGWKI
ncbi:MAG: class I SAM-dependent methyltransferase [Methylophilaceae bacterium]